MNAEVDTEVSGSSCVARIRFSKLGKVRWISHRDVARVWERALRRAALPVSYTRGFSPRPQLSFGLALPTGCESTAEYLDVAFSRDIDLESAVDGLAASLPQGIEVMACAIREGRGSLQEEVTSCSWEMTVSDADRSSVSGAVERVLSADRIDVERERKGRRTVDDLRPSILRLEARPPGLVAELGTRPRGVRPVELAEVMNVHLGPATRTNQWIERDGSKFEPLRMDASPRRSRDLPRELATAGARCAL